MQNTDITDRQPAESNCQHTRQAAYILQELIGIPTDIFRLVQCHDHDDPESRYVECLLFPDCVITDNEDIASWPTTYYGTRPEIILSILQHGEILMSDDIAQDGWPIERGRADADEKPAIWTYPTVEGALERALTITLEDESAQFTILMRLRQRPGSFVSHDDLLYSTNRRGTLFFEAVYLYIDKCTDEKRLSEPMAFLPTQFEPNLTCQAQCDALQVLFDLGLRETMFNNSETECYCECCYPRNVAERTVVSGEVCEVPIGWVRYSLAVNTVFMRINDVLDSWPEAYHGCSPDIVVSIIRHRTLLIPHDIMMDGSELSVKVSADPGQKCYFLSPSITYSAHPWYSEPRVFTNANGEVKYYQTCFAFRIRHESFDRQQETEGKFMTKNDKRAYSIIPEAEIEWYSARRGCLHPVALLIRTLSIRDVRLLYGNCVEHFPNFSTYCQSIENSESEDGNDLDFDSRRDVSTPSYVNDFDYDYTDLAADRSPFDSQNLYDCTVSDNDNTFRQQSFEDHSAAASNNSDSPTDSQSSASSVDLKNSEDVDDNSAMSPNHNLTPLSSSGSNNADFDDVRVADMDDRNSGSGVFANHDVVAMEISASDIIPNFHDFEVNVNSKRLRQHSFEERSSAIEGRNSPECRSLASDERRLQVAVSDLHHEQTVLSSTHSNEGYDDVRVANTYDKTSESGSSALATRAHVNVSVAVQVSADSSIDLVTRRPTGTVNSVFEQDNDDLSPSNLRESHVAAVDTESYVSSRRRCCMSCAIV